MTGTSVALIITAIGTGITALSLLAGTLPALIAVLHRTKKVETVLGQVEHSVNQTGTDARNYNAALIRALNDAGITVPIDQSGGAVIPPVVPPVPSDASNGK
jgi:hypothetical protein